MQGSIRKHGKSWQYRINLGKVDGKRKALERSGFATKKEANIAMNEKLNELNTTGKVFIDTNTLFGDIFEYFIINEAPITRKEPTIIRYKSLYNNQLKEMFAHRKMTQITSNELQKFITEKCTTHSVSYVISIYNFLHVLFGYAKRMNYVQTNPMENVKAPKSTGEADISVYTTEQLKYINERLATTNLQLAYQLGINLGVRVGECFALQWSDFDFNTNSVKITKQLQCYNSEWCFTTLKTQNSYRTITFTERFKKYLLEQKELQEQLQNGRTYKKDNIVIDKRKDKPLIMHINDFVNIKTNGEMLNTNSVKVATRIFKNESDIDFKFHTLRHTHATLLLEEGINPKFVQNRLGHSKLDFTLKVYTHITSKMDTQANNALDNRLDF